MKSKPRMAGKLTRVHACGMTVDLTLVLRAGAWLSIMLMGLHPVH